MYSPQAIYLEQASKPCISCYFLVAPRCTAGLSSSYTFLRHLLGATSNNKRIAELEGLLFSSAALFSTVTQLGLDMAKKTVLISQKAAQHSQDFPSTTAPWKQVSHCKQRSQSWRGHTLSSALRTQHVLRGQEGISLRRHLRNLHIIKPSQKYPLSVLKEAVRAI